MRNLADHSLALTTTEIAALVDTDPALWMRAADLIDRRLQKASLINQPSLKEESNHHV